jgi:hypothetical protein
MLMREVLLPRGDSGSPRAGANCRRSGVQGSVAAVTLLAAGPGAGRDRRVPAHLAGYDYVQPAQQRGGTGGAGLLAGEPIVVAGGQVSELAASTWLFGSAAHNVRRAATRRAGRPRRRRPEPSAGRIRAAGLKENSVTTYVSRTAQFLKWLDGDCQPRGPK